LKKILEKEKAEEIIVVLIDGLINYLEIGKRNNVSKQNAFAIKLIDNGIYDDLCVLSDDIKNKKVIEKMNSLLKYFDGLIDENVNMI